MNKCLVAVLTFALLGSLSFAVPPRPGSGIPEPVYPPGVEEAGPNKLAGYGQCETVTILMQFPDNRADTIARRPARFDSMLYSTGVYQGQQYRQGSLNDFYVENSYGGYSVKGAVGGNRWFTSRYNYSRYYDGNYMLSTGGTLARENMVRVDSFVDFSQYDLNHDGHVDAMFMVHAGADGADDGNVNHCWSHALPSFNYLTNDGVRIDGVTNVPEYAMVTETRDTTLCCIAVMCHELGHLVGLPDLYDGSRYYYGPSYWGLMSYGAWGAGGNTPWSPSHMEAWSKIAAGFVTPTVITRDTYGLRVVDVETHPVIYKVWRNGLNVDTCFYLENRQLKGFDSPLPGPGLLIWHIDPYYGSYYRRVDLEEDSTAHLDHGNGVRPDPHVYHEIMGDTSDPLPGNWNRTVFDSATKPNSRNRAGAATNVSVRNIRVAGDTIICDVTLGTTIHDVGAAAIVLPAGTIDSGTVVTPACTVQNYGTAVETYRVRLRIGTGYNETASVASQPAGNRLRITFPNWTALPRGPLTVSCSTELATDAQRTNDRRTGSVTVRVPDVGVSAIVAPAGNLDSGTAVVPACSVYNYGTGAESYIVRLKIGTGHNVTGAVTGHAAGTVQYVTFPSWTASPTGNLTVSCSTELTGDAVPANNRRAGSVTVQAPSVSNVGCTKLITPVGALDSGANATPACSVYNYGTTTASYSVRMRIGTGYNHSTAVSSHAPGTRQYVTFPNWSALPRGTSVVSCSTELTGDGQPGNDRQTGSINVAVHDVATGAILAPVDTISPGPVSPQARLRNHGTAREPISVTFAINASPPYSSALAIPQGLPVGTDTVLSFASWTATAGSFIARCSTYLGGDQVPGNNAVQSGFTVRPAPATDVGVMAILAPRDMVVNWDSVFPIARIRNLGSAPAGGKAFFRIDSAHSVIYRDSATFAGLDSLTDVRFRVWPPFHSSGADYAAICSVHSAGDGNAGNDVLQDSFAVVHLGVDSGWRVMADVPAGGKARNVKDGGALAWQAGTDSGYIYAFKGNGRYEFYQFNVTDNVWLTKESIPAIGSAGGKKPVKKGSVLAFAKGKVFGAKGNSTIEWWCYDPAGNAWTEKASVPMGARAMKEGVGAAVVGLGDTTYIYLLKGGGTQEFYRYNVQSNTWESKAVAPAGASGKMYKNGSGLAFDGDRTIYALKATYNEFFAYTVSSDAWATRAALPMIGSIGKKKKVKDGAGIAWLGGHAYALKGGNTREFYRYTPATDAWQQFEDLPLAGGRNVKGGGALVSTDRYLYALKGNNTREFFRYAANHGEQATSGRATAVQGWNPTKVMPVWLAVAPNPSPGAAMVDCVLERPGCVNLSLYDIAGKRVMVLNDGYRPAGPASWPIRAAPGVYLLRLQTAEYALTHKIIVE